MFSIFSLYYYTLLCIAFSLQNTNMATANEPFDTVSIPDASIGTSDDTRETRPATDDIKILPATEDVEIDEVSTFKNMMAGRINHAIWLALRDIINCICKCDGIIFGGAIRDYVKRSLAAKEFFDFCESKDKRTAEQLKKQYNKPTCHPETYQARTLLPKDLDVFITEDNLAKLEPILTEKFNMKYNKDGKDEICYFFRACKLFEEALQYKRGYVKFIKSSNDKLQKVLLGQSYDAMKFKIDFVILRTSHVNHEEAFDGGLLYPTFGNPDVNVNLLAAYYSHHNDTIKIKVLKPLHKPLEFGGILLDPVDSITRDHEILQNVFSDIKHNRAVPVFPDMHNMRKIYGVDVRPAVSMYRLHKMLIKGYRIDSKSMMLHYPGITRATTDSVFPDDDECIICRDTFSHENPWYRFGCDCKVKMHLDCYIKYLHNPTLNYDSRSQCKISCPHCRRCITNKYSRYCHCYLMNYYASIEHYLKFLEDRTSCASCQENPDCCRQWYHNCNNCDEILNDY